jgi:hypothetical protein
MDPAAASGVEETPGLNVETFKLDYLIVLTAVLAAVAIVLTWLRHKKPSHESDQAVTSTHRGTVAGTDAAHRVAAAKEVRIPWGWPGHQPADSPAAMNGRRPHSNGNNGAGGRSSGLQRWVDGLISEKRTVDDETYLSRRDEAIRALLEDRYGRRVRPTPGRQGRDPQADWRIAVGDDSRVPSDLKSPWGW